VHVLLGPEYHGSWITKGQGFEVDMFMVLLVCKVGGARDVAKYGGWPGGIVSVWHESEDMGIRGREQVCDLHMVPWKVLVVALHL